MNCEQCQTLLPDYSAGALDGAEADQVAAHLATGCAPCQVEWEQCRDALAALALSVPLVAPPASVKQTLLQRVRASQPAGWAAGTAVESPRLDVLPLRPAGRRASGWFVLPYAAAAACAMVAGGAVVWWADHRITTQATLQRKFAQELAAAQETFHSPRVRYAALGFAGGPAAAGSYVIWDSLARQVHFIALDLPPPDAGRRYELWFVTADGQAIHVGPLVANAQGHCAAVLDLPELPANIARAVVTDEPAVDAQPDQPTGAPRMIAEFAK